MKAITHTLIIASLFTSATCLADEPKQNEIATEAAVLEQLVVKADIDVEQSLDKLQQQLTDSIRQQASNAISSLADSIRTMMH